MTSKINPGAKPTINGPASHLSAPKLIREAAKYPQGSTSLPVRYTPELRGEALKSKLAIFKGGK